jgi:hypothetical protein
MIDKRVPKLIGARYLITAGRNDMPRVERTGIYRDNKGNALFLRKDRVAGADVLANYTLDESAELPEAWQAIADADNDAPESVNAPKLVEFGTVGTLPTVNGESVEASENVNSRETDTVEYPQALGAETPESPAPVKPSRRSSKKSQAAADVVETPEDASVESETVAVGEIQAVENKNAEGAFETPESQAVRAGGDADGDGVADDDEHESAE